MSDNSIEDIQFFIAADGNDKNPGTFEKPFASLEKARDVIRDLKKINTAIERNITVYIRGGRYFRRYSFELNEADSGSKDSRIVYKAYNNERVFIDGGIVINNSDVKPVSDPGILSRIIDVDARPNIKQVDLNLYNIPQYGAYGNRGFRRTYIPAPNELYIDGQPQTVASWPNKGEKPVPLTTVTDSGSKPRDMDYSLRGATFKYDCDRPDKWIAADDLYVSGIFKVGYADDTIKVSKIDTVKHTLTTELPHLYGFEVSDFTNWVGVNLLEEIDVPGEYYVDRADKKLYFYPPYDVSSSIIQLSIMEEAMVAMENASYITFEGITFENTRGQGLYIEGGTFNLVAGCTLRNIGGVGIQIGQGATILPEGRHNGHGDRDYGVEAPVSASRIVGNWHEILYELPAWNNNGGSRHGILSCDIYNMGSGGILLGGGDRKTLTAAGNYVENCHIYEVNRLDKSYRAAVNISGVGNIIKNCYIHGMEGSAIYLHGNDHLIEYNKIHDVLRSSSDMGAIYMGRDASEVGNVFRYNFIYGIRNPHKGGLGACAIFFDDGSIYNEVYGNYFYDIKGDYSAIFWNQGGQTSVANNIAIDCEPGLFDKGTNNSYVKMHEDELFKSRVSTAAPDDYRGVDITEEPYKSRYPYLYDTYTKDYNHGVPDWNTVRLNNDYSQFEDTNPSHLNFKIKGDSWIIKQVAHNVYDRVHGVFNKNVPFEVIDFDRIGLYADVFRGECI